MTTMLDITQALRDVKIDLGVDGSGDDEAIKLHIRRAIETIKGVRPIPNSTRDEYEATYHNLITEMAVYSWSKRGHDGASSASEQGIARGYEAGSYPKSMLRRITPRVVGY